MTNESPNGSSPDVIDAPVDAPTKPNDTASLRADIGDTIADLVPDTRPTSGSPHRDIGGPGGWRKWR